MHAGVCRLSSVVALGAAPAAGQAGRGSHCVHAPLQHRPPGRDQLQHPGVRELGGQGARPLHAHPPGAGLPSPALGLPLRLHRLRWLGPALPGCSLAGGKGESRLCLAQVADFNLSRSVMHGAGISVAELNSVEWAAPEKLAGQVRVQSTTTWGAGHQAAPAEPASWILGCTFACHAACPVSSLPCLQVYGREADVYSFGVCLWSLITLQVGSSCRLLRHVHFAASLNAVRL